MKQSQLQLLTLPQAVRALEEKKITYPATVFFSINGRKYLFRRKGTMLTKFHIHSVQNTEGKTYLQWSRAMWYLKILMHIYKLDWLVWLVYRILWKKNEVADYEATTFSIFYNNTLFLVLVIVASFFILKNFNPTVYPAYAFLEV